MIQTGSHKILYKHHKITVGNYIKNYSLTILITENKNYNAETQSFTCKNLPASPIENMDNIMHSQPKDTCFNETAETDFNSILLDDGTLFSSHTVNTLIDFDDNGQANHHNNKNNNLFNDTTNNTNFYQNHQHRQTVNSTELTQLYPCCQT